jgi:dephospho-CoA kinase
VKRLVVGVTGGIGSGKSEVMKRLSRLGIVGVSSDDLAHDCLEPRHPAYQRVVKRFGRDILLPDGRVDRKALGRIVFAEPSKRRELERIIHPYVMRGLKDFAHSHRGIIALDIPLLFEAGLRRRVHVVICVTCRPDQQVSRVVRRNGLSAAEVRKRIKAQWPLRRKAALSDYVIDNSGPLKALAPQVKKLAGKLRARHEAGRSMHGINS